MTKNESYYSLKCWSSRDNPTAESLAKADAFDAAVAAAMREAMIDPLLGQTIDELLGLHNYLDDMAGWPFAFAGALSALILCLMAQAVRAGKSTEAAAAEAQGRCRFVAREVDRRIDLAIAAPASATRLSDIFSDLEINGHKTDVVDGAMAMMPPKHAKHLEEDARDLLALEARDPAAWSYNFASGISTIALLHVMGSYLDAGMEVDRAFVGALAAARVLRAEIAKAKEAAEKAVTPSRESSFSEEAMGENDRPDRELAGSRSRRG
jgi:hypothetical protein